MKKITIEMAVEYYKSIPRIFKEMNEGKYTEELTDYINSVRIKEIAANKEGFSLLNPGVDNYWIEFSQMALSPCCLIAMERAEKDGLNPSEEYDKNNRVSRCKWCPMSHKHRYKNTDYQCRPNRDPVYRRKTDIISAEETLDMHISDRTTPLWMIEELTKEIIHGIKESEGEVNG